MSEISARASRRAFCFGSCTMNGFTGRNGPVGRLPGALTPAEGAAGAAGGAARALDAAGGDWGAGGAGARGGAGGAGGAAAARAVAAAGTAPSTLTEKILLQTLQRARMPPAGTLAGSTR